MPFVFRALRGGGSPAERILRIKKAITPTASDCLAVVNLQKTKILERTTQGVDVSGNAFAPYSTKRYFYFYPSVHLGKSQGALKTRKNAVRRLLKITGGIAEQRAEYLGSTSVGGVRTYNGLGIRFESYADAKASLGRAGVDLFGIGRGPHMLQSIVTAATPSSMTIGLYGDTAVRARAHNEGTGTLPRRHFLGASHEDRLRMVRELYRLIEARLKQ